MNTATLTIVFDNHAGLPELQTLWGFAALIRTSTHTMLFDTGSNGRILLKNMQALGIDPATIDSVFLSHPHWDHMGGLDSILELNPQVTVIVHEGFSKHLINDLRGLCRMLIVVSNEPYRIASGIYSTGMLNGEPPEQALILEIGEALAIVGGCAHPGIVQLVTHSQELMNKPVHWAIGGFHLMYSEEAAIAQAVTQLQQLGVSKIAATHCTGNTALAAFRDAYGVNFIAGGVGRVIELF
jgi:7,8-dihydropterin-6-yl-methyl-4-(beta-D-ribofuranosyl)aminobenzene 5'-phosphate synthase